MGLGWLEHSHWDAEVWRDITEQADDINLDGVHWEEAKNPGVLDLIQVAHEHDSVFVTSSASSLSLFRCEAELGQLPLPRSCDFKVTAKVASNVDRLRFGLAILNRISTIILRIDSLLCFTLRKLWRFQGYDSGIVQFAILSKPRSHPFWNSNPPFIRRDDHWSGRLQVRF